MSILLTGDTLTLEQFDEIVHKGTAVAMDGATRKKLGASREIVEKAIRSGKRVYSINTGFGILSKVTIDPSQLDELQINFIRSHCVGVGEPHSELESRALLLLRTNVLAKAYSGVRPELVELLIECLNRRVHPVIPWKGSVGCSGDLAPLAHLAAVLIGEGEAFYRGERLTGGEALQRAGLAPIQLAPKEGLSLANGTQQMNALGCLYLLRAEKLVDLADWICSATLDGILGSAHPYEPWIHESRPHAGQGLSAARLLKFSKESEIASSHADCDRVQDPYSLRCAPQVHGAARDLFTFCRQTFAIEVNSATDNPLVNPKTGEVVSNGNFHGQPLAFALDILAMGVSELASISERRIVKLMNPVFSELPTFLVKQEGLNSGFMMAQYTAAHLVCESRLLTHPASTDSVSTNNDKEDHNSMGPVGARKLKTILENTEYVLAIEALAACQALDFRKPLKPGVGPRKLYEAIRAEVPPLEKDRYLHKDIEKIASLVRDGSLFETLKPLL